MATYLQDTSMDVDVPFPALPPAAVAAEVPSVAGAETAGSSAVQLPASLGSDLPPVVGAGSDIVGAETAGSSSVQLLAPDEPSAPVAVVSPRRSLVQSFYSNMERLFSSD
jgi:hypothetical protein